MMILRKRKRDEYSLSENNRLDCKTQLIKSVYIELKAKG